MSLSGSELYYVWASRMADQGVEVDDWSDLCAADQEAWISVASYCNHEADLSRI